MFTQPTSAFAPFRFVLIADPHLMQQDRPGVAKLQEALRQIRDRVAPLFVIYLGDFAYRAWQTFALSGGGGAAR